MAETPTGIFFVFGYPFPLDFLLIRTGAIYTALCCSQRCEIEFEEINTRLDWWGDQMIAWDRLVEEATQTILPGGNRDNAIDVDSDY